MSNEVTIEGKVNGYIIDYGYNRDFSSREERVYLTWDEVIAQLQTRPIPFMVLKDEESETITSTAVDPSTSA
jgi:hypothetical protein